MSRPSSRLGLVLAATLVTGSLTLGAGVAGAQPPPPAPDTPACETLVAQDTAVVAAEQALTTATDANRAAAQTALEQAETEARKQCTGTPEAEEQTDGTDGAGGGTGTGTENEQQPGGDPEADGQEQGRGEQERDEEQSRGGGPAAGEGLSGVGQSIIDKDPSDVDCRDFRTQPAAQAYFEFVATPEDPDPAGLDRDNDGKACESLVDLDGAEIAQVSDEDLDQTADDGSEPETTQVSEVPAGSIDTGSAQ